MSPSITAPDYGGGSLLNLVAELEHRLTGRSESPRLHPELGALIPEADTYVLAVMDGLGAAQLRHRAAVSMATSQVGVIDAPFPTTTTVSLATVATGLSPRRHGLIGYQLHLPETIDDTDPRRASVVNTIKWRRLWGDPVAVDTRGFLPSPNLWERLRDGGVEPITVQPAHFDRSPLTEVLYRGCRFEGVYSTDELVAATIDLAAEPSRLILAYLPDVDFAAHVHGQSHTEYEAALRVVDSAWSALEAKVAPSATLIGTADHGHRDYPQERQVAIPLVGQSDLTLYGDSRAMFVRGDAPDVLSLPATLIPFGETQAWWGPGPDHPRFEERRPDAVLMADDDTVLLHRHSDSRLTGHHGGLTDDERQVPLLVGRPGSG